MSEEIIAELQAQVAQLKAEVAELKAAKPQYNQEPSFADWQCSTPQMRERWIREGYAPPGSQGYDEGSATSRMAEDKLFAGDLAKLTIRNARKGLPDSVVENIARDARRGDLDSGPTRLGGRR
jgi:hypothetical protein